jgi:peptidoglycan/xylan/chitin deacetylase (PgdA/CDA1 family)
MNVDELRALHAAGIEVGAHTRSHVNLADADRDRALAELHGSRRDLETMLGAEVTTAAYPFGGASLAARQACRDAGFVAAAGTFGHGGWHDRFHLPRQDMSNRSSDVGLVLKAHDRYRAIVETWPGRAARRVRLHALGRPVRGWPAGRNVGALPCPHFAARGDESAAWTDHKRGRLVEFPRGEQALIGASDELERTAA